MIVGVDRIKDEAVLNAAYDDAAGVTAQFNLNILRRMNRELGGDFDLAAFRHRAFYNVADNRIEMHSGASRPQTVTVRAGLSNFAKAKPSTPRTPTSTRWSPSARWPRAPAGGRSHAGPTRTTGSPCMR
jgi:uncharacterized SAM-dependent methyltransferase